MERIYYLPGRDTSITDDIGQVIEKIGFSVIGRDLQPDFINYRIAQQVEIIKQDISEYISESGSHLIARSYGAYLLLQALAEMNPFQGRILLLNPVLGPSNIEIGRIFFRPPRANKLINLARERRFPEPEYLEIHIGSNDLQCHPSLAVEFSNLVANTKLKLVERAGHNFEHNYIENVLKKFLFA
jgi:hypothetical protein